MKFTVIVQIYDVNEATSFPNKRTNLFECSPLADAECLRLLERLFTATEQSDTRSASSEQNTDRSSDSAARSCRRGLDNAITITEFLDRNAQYANLEE